jgi:hypothetical protein
MGTYYDVRADADADADADWFGLVGLTKDCIATGPRISSTIPATTDGTTVLVPVLLTRNRNWRPAVRLRKNRNTPTTPSGTSVTAATGAANAGPQEDWRARDALKRSIEDERDELYDDHEVFETEEGLSNMICLLFYFKKRSRTTKYFQVDESICSPNATISTFLLGTGTLKILPRRYIYVKTSRRATVERQ